MRATNFNIKPPWLHEGFGLASPGIIASLNYVCISLHMQLHCICHIWARSHNLSGLIFSLFWTTATTSDAKFELRKPFYKFHSLRVLRNCVVPKNTPTPPRWALLF